MESYANFIQPFNVIHPRIRRMEKQSTQQPHSIPLSLMSVSMATCWWGKELEDVELTRNGLGLSHNVKVIIHLLDVYYVRRSVITYVAMIKNRFSMERTWREWIRWIGFRIQGEDMNRVKEMMGFSSICVSGCFKVSNEKSWIGSCYAISLNKMWSGKFYWRECNFTSGAFWPLLAIMCVSVVICEEGSIMESF